MEEGRSRPSNECIEWDALDQLTAINQGTHRSEFSYDAEGRRARIVEKDTGLVVDDRRLVWLGAAIAEERDPSGLVISRSVGGGYQRDGASYVVMGDHLGSVREIVDGSGELRARYDYEPWGTRTKISGDQDTLVAFAGHRVDASTGLSLALHRGYDGRNGRWLSADPIGLSGGLNLYRYSKNNPINAVDPLGLCESSPTAGQIFGAIGQGLLIGLVSAVAVGLVIAALGLAFPIVAVAMAAIPASVWAGAAVIGAGIGAFQAIQLARRGCTLQALRVLGGTLGGMGAGPLLRGIIGRLTNPWTSAGFNQVVTTQPTPAFRVIGGNSPTGGRWLAANHPLTSPNAMASLALQPGNPATTIIPVTIPAGTTIRIGPASGIFGQPGGAIQIFVPGGLPSSAYGTPMNLPTYIPTWP